MAEVVAIAGLVGVLVGWTIAGIWAGIELRQLRERLDALGTLLAEFRRADGESKPQTHDHPLTAATQFAGNALVRAWWLGEQGRKRVQEKEEE